VLPERSSGQEVVLQFGLFSKANLPQNNRPLIWQEALHAVLGETLILRRALSYCHLCIQSTSLVLRRSFPVLCSQTRSLCVGSLDDSADQQQRSLGVSLLSLTVSTHHEKYVPVVLTGLTLSAFCEMHYCICRKTLRRRTRFENLFQCCVALTQLAAKPALRWESYDPL
jgi:hypothetical protein